MVRSRVRGPLFRVKEHKRGTGTGRARRDADGGATIADALPADTLSRLLALRSALAGNHDRTETEGVDCGRHGQAAGGRSRDPGLGSQPLSPGATTRPLGREGRPAPGGQKASRDAPGLSPRASKSGAHRADLRSCPETPPEPPWEDPPTGAIRIEVPLAIRQDDVRAARELIQAGTSPDTGPEGGPFFVLGIDFGTSSTKVVARLPYEAGEPAWAIPAPSPCRYHGAPSLY